MTLQTPKAQSIEDLAAYYDTDLPQVESATYTPYGGSAVSVTVRLVPGQGLEGEGADALGINAIARIRTSQVSTVAPGAVLVIGSNTWEVISADLATNGNEWICEINKR